MLKKIIQEFTNSDEKVRKYKQGVQLLKEAGFIDLLRKFGYPSIIDQGNNPYSMATEAARSHGFQSAVSHLESFLEMYVFNSENKGTFEPSFGAEQFLLKEKIMTQEEIAKLKGGKI